MRINSFALAALVAVGCSSPPRETGINILALMSEVGFEFRKPDLVIPFGSPGYLAWNANEKPQEHYRSGRYTVVFGRLENEGAVWPLAVYLGAPPQPKANVVFLPWPCRVTVAVVDTNGQPVEGTAVSVEADGIPAMSQTTDAKGIASFFPVVEGEVAVQVGERSPLQLRVTPRAPLRLKLLASDGTPVE